MDEVLDILDPLLHLLSHQGHRWSWPGRYEVWQRLGTDQRTKLAAGGEAGLAASLSLQFRVFFFD